METPAAGTKAVKKKNNTREGEFRYALDTCSKTGDLSGALALYESAVAEKLRLSAYHFNSLLHVISSSIEALGRDDDHAKQSAVEAGFRIFDSMVAAGMAPNEATVTSMARISSQRPDGTGGEVAFDLVRNMEERYGATPKLRTYCPALFAFCRELEAEKAYTVEDHMASRGVVLEEPEIAALLEVSAKVGKEEEVYQYLHKLRSNMGCVANSTAEILERWFGSQQAAEVGSLNWDTGRVKNAILMNGGGWHGLGWLGKGGWKVNRVNVSAEGFCCCCGLKLACVDIDRMETQKFTESVASLAIEREARSNFKIFQEWLDNHTRYEAIIDGANVGLYQQNFSGGGFSLSQLDMVVKELLERNKNIWPLIVLHNKRIPALMENPTNRKLLEKWSSEGALYTTPSGSNDDWYWLYAAVKLKCLLVTNDEMRDHIFELLGRSFFLKWKERHQVRYTFVKGRLALVMPPIYSVVIQESVIGSWHVPLDDKCNSEELRTWLCINRPQSGQGLNKDGLVDDRIKTATEEHYDMLTVPSENHNGKKLSFSLQPSSHKSESITGKRKERSSP